MELTWCPATGQPETVQDYTKYSTRHTHHPISVGQRSSLCSQDKQIATHTLGKHYTNHSIHITELISSVQVLSGWVN